MNKVVGEGSFVLSVDVLFVGFLDFNLFWLLFLILFLFLEFEVELELLVVKNDSGFLLVLFIFLFKKFDG